MKANPKHQFCGIYRIINKINGKYYIGKSKNIYKRIHQHIYHMKNNKKAENAYLQNSWNKYGRDSFDYDILEQLDFNETLIAQRELYWIKFYDSTNKGYNLRLDSKTGMICHEKTRKKISDRLKKEWSEGKRDTHSDKLKKSWKNRDRQTQSKLFSKTLTRYIYNINGIRYSHQELKEKGWTAVYSSFHRKKQDVVTYKEMIVERIRL
jgi:group I intron endonuclease